MLSCIDLAGATTIVERVFYPTYDCDHGVLWLGPDPLSHDTCGEDLFNFLTTFLIQEPVDWIEFRLRMLSNDIIRFSDESVFFLPRKESLMGNLPRIREQVRGLISKTSGFLQARCHFQLAIYSYRERFSILSPEFEHDSPSNADCMKTLDPHWFVHNIAGNFD